MAPLQASTELSTNALQGSRKKHRKAKTTKVITPADTTASSSLVADGFNIIEKMRVERKLAKEAQLEAEREETLKYPAVELYGENSWGEYVNPFAGCVGKANIPDNYDIDCNGFVMPLDKDTHITSNYGYRRRYRRMHRGVDLKLNTGDTVRAAFDGRVRINDYEGKGYGHYIVIRHDNGLETVYGHLSKKLVKRGEIVRAGDPIGLGGSTGRSTGPHLHFEARFMGVDLNPTQLFDFAEKVPLRDYYTFTRNGRNYASSASVASVHSTNKKSRVGKASAPQTHRIRKGDTLSTIAQRYGTTVTKLCALNNMGRKATLRVGKSIRVK